MIHWSPLMYTTCKKYWLDRIGIMKKDEWESIIHEIYLSQLSILTHSMNYDEVLNLNLQQQQTSKFRSVVESWKGKKYMVISYFDSILTRNIIQIMYNETDCLQSTNNISHIKSLSYMRLSLQIFCLFSTIDSTYNWHLK